MLQTKLINRADIKVHKQISNSIFDDVVDSITMQVQLNDIAPLLGELLFNDLMLNPTNYADLLNGGAYTVGGITHQNYGLKAVLSYYWYAHYTMFGDVTDTPFGLMQKTAGEGSVATSQKSKDALWHFNKQYAFNIWKSIENYLIRTNNELFLKNNCIFAQNKNFNFQKIG